jgi:hypothetical protein
MSFTYSIDNGHGGAASATVSLTVKSPFVVQSLYGPADAPATPTVQDGNAVELGVKFQSTVAGQIIGIKFYKGPQNTGTHVAHLWNASGTLLASATFSGESASGWQSVTFPAVPMAANTTYIASYHTNGFYSVTAKGFAGAHTNGTLTAPSSASSGGNGVFVYGAGGFPNSTYNANNYFVDVLTQIPNP